MGQLLPGRSGTTAAVPRAMPRSQESLATRAEPYDFHPKTAAKWKKRSGVRDAPVRPERPCSTVLSREEEAHMVTFRKHTLLSLDDCLYALRGTLPQLTRSALHHCLQRHGSSCLPAMKGDTPQKKTFKPYPIGYFPIDITEVRTEEGRLSLSVAIDRTGKFAYAELHPEALKTVAAQLLR
jgi:hypothetical protein